MGFLNRKYSIYNVIDLFCLLLRFQFVESRLARIVACESQRMHQKAINNVDVKFDLQEEIVVEARKNIFK